MNLAELMKPSPLSYYQSLAPAQIKVSLTLENEQSAVILKAHDYGIAALTAQEVAVLDRLMSALKDEIHP